MSLRRKNQGKSPTDLISQDIWLIDLSWPSGGWLVQSIQWKQILEQWPTERLRSGSFKSVVALQVKLVVLTHIMDRFRNCSSSWSSQNATCCCCGQINPPRIVPDPRWAWPPCGSLTQCYLSSGSTCQCRSVCRVHIAYGLHGAKTHISETTDPGRTGTPDKQQKPWQQFTRQNIQLEYDVPNHCFKNSVFPNVVWCALCSSHWC